MGSGPVKSCFSKQAYNSLGEARKQQNWQRKIGRDLQPYKCTSCGKWHLGHQEKPHRGYDGNNYTLR